MAYWVRKRGDSVTYTVHFDRNPSGFDNVECGEPVYVNMRGFDSSEFRVEPSIPEFRTGDAACEGGNWNRLRTIEVMPAEDTDAMPRRTITIAHAVWDNDDGTPVEEDDAPKVMRVYMAPKVLVVDEFGIWPYDRESATAFFTLVSARYERGDVFCLKTSRVRCHLIAHEAMCGFL